MVARSRRTRGPMSGYPASWVLLFVDRVCWRSDEDFDVARLGG
jgi:hypothetical protein